MRSLIAMVMKVFELKHFYFFLKRLRKGYSNSVLKDYERNLPTWSGLCSRGQLSH